MKLNLNALPRFFVALGLALLLAFVVSDEFGIRKTLSVPLSLFLVVQIQKRGYL